MRLTHDTFTAAYDAIQTPTKETLLAMGASKGIPDWYMIACIGTTEGEGYVNELYLNYEWACTFLNYDLENYYPAICASKEAMYNIMGPWDPSGVYYSESAVTNRYNNASDSTLKCVYLAFVDRDRNTRAVSGDYYDQGYYAYYHSTVYPDIYVWYTTGESVIDDSDWFEFTVRDRSPEGENNPCYMTNGTSGLLGSFDSTHWNTCILGSPTVNGANVLANCTGYAEGRSLEIYNEATGYDPVTAGGHPWEIFSSHNAGEWYGVAEQSEDFEVNPTTPTPGAIMVWDKAASAGHVAVVEEVIDNDTVITSESGYGGIAGQTWITHTRRRGTDGLWSGDLLIMGGYTFLGFISNLGGFSPIPPGPEPPTPPGRSKKFKWWLFNKKCGYIIRI